MGADAERILVLGNVNVDLVMGEVDAWPAVGSEVILPRSEMRPGGSAGNTALALSGMGVPHRLIAATGSDMMGRWLAGQFDARHSTWIDTAGGTTITVGIVHAGGDRAFFTTTAHLHTASLDDLVARLPKAPGEGSWALISGGFLMPRIEAGTLEVVERLRGMGWSVAIDPGWPPEGWTQRTRTLATEWLAAVDLALINAEEAIGLTGEAGIEAAVSSLAAEMAENAALVVKCGPDGVRIRKAQTDLAIRAPRVEVIDTVGAGDTFNAAFLASLSRGEALLEAGERGVRAASRAISTFPRRYSD